MFGCDADDARADRDGIDVYYAKKSESTGNSFALHAINRPHWFRVQFHPNVALFQIDDGTESARDVVDHCFTFCAYDTDERAFSCRSYEA
jgi:hypothetical protein